MSIYLPQLKRFNGDKYFQIHLCDLPTKPSKVTFVGFDGMGEGGERNINRLGLLFSQIDRSILYDPVELLIFTIGLSAILLFTFIHRVRKSEEKSCNTLKIESILKIKVGDTVPFYRIKKVGEA